MNQDKKPATHETCAKHKLNLLNSITYGGDCYNKNQHHSSTDRRPTTKVRFIDQPCGTGKTTSILNGLRPGEHYLIVVPLLSEVDRILKHANVSFDQPDDKGNRSKSDHFYQLLREKKNIVLTHKLFSDIAFARHRGLLREYEVIIDEVLDVVVQEHFCSLRSFETVYVDGGFAEYGPEGFIVPTAKWNENFDRLSDTLSMRHYHAANNGTLLHVGGDCFAKVMPLGLILDAKSVTIYTYMAKGSMMYAYLNKAGVHFEHTRWADEKSWISKVAKLVTVKDIASLNNVPFTYSGQTEKKGKAKKEKIVGAALANLKRHHLSDVAMSDVIITCAKDNWFKELKGKQKHQGFATNSRMQKANWLPNMTRGTNDYAHASVCIYLFDQHPNPFIARWLGIDTKEAKERYALAELIQWVFRSRVRNGEPITLYLPSARMRRLWDEWANGLS